MLQASGSRLVAQRPDWHAGIERKSARELALMREAGRITALALAEMRAQVRPGITTLQLDAVAEKVILKNKAEPAFKGYPGPYPYPYTTTISVNDELVHGLPSARVIREGDLVSLDCGVRYQGFYADAALSVGVGECAPLVKKLLDVTEKALYAGLVFVKAGHRVGEAAYAMHQFVSYFGFHLANSYTSHGVGRYMHEDPEIRNDMSRESGVLLKPGMTIALEPMVLVGTAETRTLSDQWTAASVDGSLTAHFEHTVVVTEGEPEILTR